MKIESTQSSGHSPSSHNAAYMSCNLSTVASPPCLNNSAVLGHRLGLLIFHYLALLSLFLFLISKAVVLFHVPLRVLLSPRHYILYALLTVFLPSFSNVLWLRNTISIFRLNTVQFRLELACYGLDCFV